MKSAVRSILFSNKQLVGLVLITRNVSTFAFDVQSGIGNFTVNWGDGSLTTHTSNATVTKNYASTGVYEITISGVFTGFNNGSIIAPIASISSWGVSKFSSMNSAFSNSLITSLPPISLDNFALVANFQNAWGNCSGLTSFPLINTAAGTNFQDAWNGCSGLTSFPLINTISGTNFIAAWGTCSGLTSFPLINTAAGTNFSYTWYGCYGLTSFPANMFDNCLATNFDGAWQDCSNLSQTSVDNIIISINTANRSNGTLRVDGSTPSASGKTAVDALRVRGWTVTVTGY